MNVDVKSIRIGKKYRIKEGAEGNACHAFAAGALVEVLAGGYDFERNESIFLCEGRSVVDNEVIKQAVPRSCLEDF